MKAINLKKEWNFITFEIHNEKPNASNALKRELLFVIQNLLSKISEHKISIKDVFLRKIYIEAKNQYLQYK